MQSREEAPVGVGLTLAFMIVGTALCMSGYVLVADLLELFE